MTTTRRGLVFRFSALVAVTVSLGVASVSVFFLLSGRKASLQQSNVETVSLAGTVAAALANSVALKEYAFIIEHCSTVVRSRSDLRYVIVVKRDGESLVHYPGGWRNAVLSDPTSLRLQQASAPMFLRHRSPLADEEVLEAVHPIAVSTARWGVIRLGVSTAPLRQREAELRRTALTIGGAVLAASLIMAALMLRVMVRPIHALTAAARRISEGDLSEPVVVRHRDEIGDLAAAFNKMVADLRGALAAEKTKADELSQAFQQLNDAHRELQRTQAQLLQTGRLASVGQLAAGVAHELNNPLSVVLTYAMLLEEKIEVMPDELRGKLQAFCGQLDKIKAGAQRCKGIADNLLAFSRQSGGECSLLEARELVDRTFDLLTTKLTKAKIKLNLEVPEGLHIFGQLGQLQQVLTNLAINALQAMEAGGQLRVRASRDGAMTVIEVQDSGPGIPPEHLDKIFDPFFTTKPIGQGTGLGLSIVYGIVNQHKGEISVDSAPGRGATFRISLPSSYPKREAHESARGEQQGEQRGEQQGEQRGEQQGEQRGEQRGEQQGEQRGEQRAEGEGDSPRRRPAADL